MINILKAFVLSAISIAPGVAIAAPMSITAESEFRALVVDKTLTLGGDQIVINSAGQMTGMIGGNPITASKWEWHDSQFCRALKTKARDFPSDCQSVKIDGNSVIFPTSTWTIQ